MAEEDITVELSPNTSERADRYLARIGVMSRSQMKTQNLIIHGGGKRIKFSHNVVNGDKLHIEWDEIPPPSIEAEDVPLNILYEDAHAVIINKPQGMVVHPGAGNFSGTLAQGLLFRYSSLDGETLRPGIVHRLDKETSGIIAAAKDALSQNMIEKQFRKRRVEKTYLAIVCGSNLPPLGEINASLARSPSNRKKFAVCHEGGKEALTKYVTLKRWKNHALLRIHPHTGRTHQIRVHLDHIGYPILGDPLYGRRHRFFEGETLMLHSWKLKLTLPEGTEPQTFKAPLPPHFLHALDRLNGLFEFTSHTFPSQQFQS